MTVGIVGAGQLGRMLALAGYPLGLDFLFLDPAKGAPAGQVAPQVVGEFTNAQLLGQLARDTEVLTFDWENISVDALRALPSSTLI
jgi:5-(carboxyamino)imidazole ribonucleotide synthase